MFSSTYCLICKDSKISPCSKCLNDSYVTIDHEDSKEIYKLSEYNMNLAKSIKNNKSNIEKYFVQDIEKLALYKHRQTNNARSKNIMNKIEQMKQERLSFMNKYVQIRKGFVKLINKSFPGLQYKFESDIYNKLKEFATSDNEIDNCVLLLYNYSLDRVTKYWNKVMLTPNSNCP